MSLSTVMILLNIVQTGIANTEKPGPSQTSFMKWPRCHQFEDSKSWEVYAGHGSPNPTTTNTKYQYAVNNNTIAKRVSTGKGKSF